MAPPPDNRCDPATEQRRLTVSWSGLALRIALQTIPVFLTIAAAQIIGRNL